LIDAFQFVEKYGEVCPANWQSGDAGMKASTAGYAAYMDKQTPDTTMSNGGTTTLKAAINGTS
jgi:peroxiredoxin (alkyl hydroperoxide reductase subunit C)